MRATREYFRNLKELPRDEMLAPGSPLCAGCGGLATLRLMLNVLGPNVIVVNAAGCLTLMAVYPFTPVRGSWLYTTMASAPAGAQGVRDALDVLIAKGRLPPEDDLKVMVLAGDGSSADMGLSSTSGAIHRGLDFYYLCYDNEAYGNTGFQMSSTSPFGSETATSPAVRRGSPDPATTVRRESPDPAISGDLRSSKWLGLETGHNTVGTLQNKKDLFEIWRAHLPPYIATLSTADPVDLAEKVRRSMQFHGPKLFIGYATCPTGWGFDPSQSHHIAKLAIETGVWPLKEAIDGEVRHTYIPDRAKPVTEYLQPQRRFCHLFSPERQAEALAEIQCRLDQYWRKVRETEQIHTAKIH